MKKHTAGILYGALASASYGMNPLFALPIYAGGVGVNSVLFYRYLLAVGIYAIWLKYVKKMSFKIHRNQILPLLFLGIFFSLSSLTLFVAFEHIAAGIACTILFIYPSIVALIMIMFFKEKFSKSVFISILLVSAGICLLYKGDASADLNMKGVLIVLSSALLYALYIIGVKNIKSVRHLNSEKMSFYVMLFGLLVYVYNLKFCTQLQIMTEPKLWLLAFGLALFPTIISIETINIAIKLIGSTKTAILGALEPLTALFFGVTLFHEPLTPRIVAGVITVLIGVFIVVLRNRKNA